LGKKGAVDGECDKDCLQRINESYVTAMKVLQAHLNQERQKIDTKIKTPLPDDKSVVSDLNGHN